MSRRPSQITITHARSDRALKSVCGDESGDWAPLSSMAPRMPPSLAVNCRRCLAILALAERERKAIELAEGALFQLRDDMGLKTLVKISDPPPRCPECGRPIQPDATHCPTCALGHVADAIGLDRDLVGGMMHSLVGNRDVGTALMANFVLRHAIPAVPDPGPMRPRTLRSIELGQREIRALVRGSEKKTKRARKKRAKKGRAKK